MDSTSTFPWTWDIEVTSDNTIYTGNELGRVYFKEEGSTWVELDLPDAIGTDDVRRVKVDGSGRIWVATNGAGIHMLDGATWTSYTMANSGLSTDNFRYFEMDDNGTVYAGGNDGGLNILTNGNWSVYNSSNSIMENDNLDILGFNANSGQVFMGSISLLYTISASGVDDKFDLEDNLGWNANVTAIYPNGNATLIGTKNGLLSFQNGVIEDMTSISGDNDVNDIAIDSEGNMWLSRTFFGLSVYNGQELFAIGNTDTIPDQVFDMVPFKDNILLVGNRGARLASVYWDNVSATYDIALTGLDIYPTITNGEIQLDLDQGVRDNHTCFIYSSLGVLIKTTPLTSSISIANFTAGTYYIKVRDNHLNKYYETKKVIKI